jgi:hypothetical protein
MSVEMRSMGSTQPPSPWITQKFLGWVKRTEALNLTSRPIQQLRGVDNDKSAFTLPFDFTNAQHKHVTIRRGPLDPEDEGIPLFRKVCM